ncbi:MAG: hypothetical protein KH161_11525 [Lachnospiraceae bacterium]|nr:hypothetical protein [Lachnospiraceae bacterium]
MKKNKIIVFGDLPIATKVVMELNEMDNIDLVGVVIGNDNPHVNDPWDDVECLSVYAKENNIRKYTLNDLVENFDENDLDLGLLCRFSKIVKKDIISLFKTGLINMHGGLLPEFAGLYSCNYSILYNSKVGGGTLHFVDEGIDTGNIIKRCEFEITDEDTGFSVFQKTQIALFEGMMEIIPKVLDNSIISIPISEFINKGYESRYFNKKSIELYKELKEGELFTEEGLRRIRAFDFPGYEPAYYMLNNKKVYLRLTK